MTPQIFAAIFVTAYKRHQDSWKMIAAPGGKGRMTDTYTMTEEDASLFAVREHKQDERWAAPISQLLLSARRDTLSWARSMI